MASATAVATLVVQATSVIVFGAVAVFIARRQVRPAARGAQRGFVIWWAGLAVLGAYRLVVNDVYGVQPARWGLQGQLVATYAVLTGLFILLGGLLYYLLFLYTGRHSSLRWPVLYYALLFVLTAYLIHGFGGACLAPEEGCVVGSWAPGDAAAIGSHEPRPEWLTALVGAGFILPPLAAAVMYFLLFFQVPDATSRYRILLVSGGIILWFTFNTATALTGVGSAEAREASALASRSFGLLAAILVLLAYFPPAPVRRRFGVRSIVQQGG